MEQAGSEAEDGVGSHVEELVYVVAAESDVAVRRVSKYGNELEQQPGRGRESA